MEHHIDSKLAMGSHTRLLCSCKVEEDSEQKTPQHLLFNDQTKLTREAWRRGKPGDTVTKATSVKSSQIPNKRRKQASRSWAGLDLRGKGTDTQARNIYQGAFRNSNWKASGRNIKPVLYLLGGAKWDGEGRQKVTRVDMAQAR